MTDDMFDHIEDMDLDAFAKRVKQEYEKGLKEGKWLEYPPRRILGENSDVDQNTRVGDRVVAMTNPTAEPTRAVEKQRSTDSKPSAIWVKDLKLWGVKDE